MNPTVIEIPSGIIALVIQIFALGATIFAVINGVKDIIPGLKDNKLLLRVINFGVSFLTTGALCFHFGQVHDLFDVLKCLVAAVMTSLVAAGIHQARRESDIARAAASVSSFKAETSPDTMKKP